MSGDLLDINGDIIETFHFDESEGVYHIQKTQDVEPILLANAEQVNHGDPYHLDPKGKNIRHVARIPAIVAEQWKKEGFDIFNCDQAELKRRLNDPDNAMFRVCKGKL